jgi:hypothetical protein
MFARVSEISYSEIPSIKQIVVACNFQSVRDLTELKLDFYNTRQRLIALLNKILLAFYALSVIHITIRVFKIYVMLQVSVCAGVNNMTMWASFLCGVTAGPVYILIHYVMIWCKGKQVLTA